MFNTYPSIGVLILLPSAVTVVSCFFMILSPILICTSQQESFLGQYSILIEPRLHQLNQFYSEMFILYCTLRNSYLTRSIG